MMAGTLIPGVGHLPWGMSILPAVLAGLLWAGGAWAADLGEVKRYHVAEVTFVGPELGPTDTPARDVELAVTFRHESGAAARVPGFWDGDGKGGSRGAVFKVRFCATRVGRSEPDCVGRRAARAGRPWLP